MEALFRKRLRERALGIAFHYLSNFQGTGDRQCDLGPRHQSLALSLASCTKALSELWSRPASSVATGFGVSVTASITDAKIVRAMRLPSTLGHSATCGGRKLLISRRM